MAERPNAARDAEIYRERKAGRTLRSLGEEYGLSRESIRRIDAQEFWREKLPDYPSNRAVGAIKFVLYHTGINRDLLYRGTKEFGIDLKSVAKNIAEAGRKAFEGRDRLGKKICSKITLAEIEAWMTKYGYRWGPGINHDDGKLPEDLR